MDLCTQNSRVKKGLTMKLAVLVSLLLVIPFQAVAGSCVGKTVEVWVANGIGLTGDALSEADPYVLVQIDGRTQSTRAIHDNANPTWWQKFLFHNSNSELMKIEVWEKDGGSRRNDDHLGTCMAELVESRRLQTVRCDVKDQGLVKVLYKCY